MRRRRARRIRESYGHEDGVKFSIVIPTYNEAGGIERLILTLDDVFRAHSSRRRDHRRRRQFARRHRGDRRPAWPRAIRCAACIGPARSASRPASSTAGSLRGRSPKRSARWMPTSGTIRRSAGDGRGARGGRVRSCDRVAYVPGGGIENWPLHRKITSLVAIALAKPLTPVRDITTGFFLVKRARSRASNSIRSVSRSASK